MCNISLFDVVIVENKIIMKRIFTLTFITILIACQAVLAQVAPGTYGLKGRLVDSATAKPAEFATISVKNTDKKPLKVQFSKPDGSFLIDKLPAGKVTVTFELLGFVGRTQEVTLSGDRRLTDLGELKLSPSNSALKGVSVKAIRSLVTHEADRIAYDLQSDPDSKANNVLEMMRKVPLITVDAQDNIQLSGNSGYRIFINGKPSSLMERDPKQVLKSMPASSVQKIEVITTPSAKYDAEGLGGIINIITNKKIDNGYTGSLDLSHRGPQGGPSLGGSFTSRSGKLGWSAFSGGGFNNNPITRSDVDRTSRDAVPFILLQNSERSSDGRNAYLGTELNYELDSLNLISGQFNLNGSNGGGSSFQRSLSQQNAVVSQRYDLNANNDNSGSGGDAALNYQRGFKRNKNQLLTVSYRYYGFENDQNTDQMFSNRTNYNLADFRQTNKSKMGEQTAQVDYVHPLKAINIEAGVKGIFRTNESNFDYLAKDAAGNYNTDPTKTNSFNNRQDILAAYNSYQYIKGKWSLKAGLRLEHTSVHADFLTTATQVDQKYFNFVPSVAIGRRFKNSGISLGWNQRIQRPGINQLNPFVDRSNPNFETTGNPDLKPTTGNQFRLSYDRSGKGNFSVSINYVLINGLIFQVSDYNETTNITRTRYENIGSAKALGGNINFNYPFTQIWSVNFNGNMMHGWAEGVSGGQPIKNKGFMFNANLNTSVKVAKTWRLSANVYANGGQLTVQQNSNRFVTTAFNVNKDIIKDKLSLSAFVNNPFDRYRVNITRSFGNNFDQISNDQQIFRSVGATISYRFGKLNSAIKKNKRGISNDDVSNN